MKDIHFLFFLFLLVTESALGLTVQFPEEELARESVLPVFDNRAAVRSRLVPTANRFEVGLGLGNALNEPFFNTTRLSGHMAYHLTETHGILLNGMLYGTGLGNNGTELSKTNLVPNPDSNSSLFIRLDHAPQPRNQVFLNYQITPYYGKISIFKNFIMNLSFYGLVGIGQVDVGGENRPAFNLGMGQKFYLSKNWGVRTDLTVVGYEGVDLLTHSDGQQALLWNMME